MTEERDDEQTTGPAGPTTPPVQGPALSIPASLDDLRVKVSEATSEFLKTRLGLEAGADGNLQFPDRGVFENFGQRADQFVRGFFRGFAGKTPDERETAGARDTQDAPSGAEVAARLLSKVSDTMSTTFHEYLKDNVVPGDKPDEQVVVDGKFLLRHGAPLLATMVQALGSRFSNEGAPEDPLAPAEPAVAEPEADKPHIDYRLDLPSVFKSLFVRPSDEGDKE